jgi:hypothetical protein
VAEQRKIEAEESGDTLNEALTIARRKPMYVRTRSGQVSSHIFQREPPIAFPYDRAIPHPAFCPLPCEPGFSVTV